MNRFQGRVALVTGASRGIGFATARRLVQEGARVIVTARKAEALQEAAESLGGNEIALAVAGAADDPEHRSAAIGAAIEAFGRLDVLVNNSAVNPHFGSMLDIDPAAARKIMEVNVLGALAWTKQAADAWLGANGGSIVNVASVAGLRPASGIGFYGTSKAALMHVTQQLAAELGPEIRVNAVAPAVVKTKFAAKLYEGAEEAVASGYALKRLGTPEEIAATIAFLASDDASWITGQTIVVDGGLMLSGGV